MRRLFWKEWRERGVWLVLMLLSVVTLSALGKGQQVFGLTESPSMWMLLPVSLSLLAGLGGYGSELSGDRATFLYSRAISWKHLLLAKVILGLSMAVTATLIGAFAYCIFAPTVYVPFLMPLKLLMGAALYAAILFVAYLTGLGCSIVLPGLAGAILVLVLLVGCFYSLVYLADVFVPNMNGNLTLIALLAIAPFAGSIIARFGITLNSRARMGRFVLWAMAPLVSMLLLDITLTKLKIMQSPEEAPGYSNVVVSPAGEFAIAYRYDGGNRNNWLNLSEGRIIPLPADQANSASYVDHWLSNECVQVSENLNQNVIYWWDREKKRPEATQCENFEEGYISPDGKRILYRQQQVRNPDVDAVKVITLQTGKTQVVTSKSADRFWWQSPTTVGYIDPFTEKTVLVPVR